MSHLHATDAPPTQLERYKVKKWPTRRLTVGQLSTDSQPTVDWRVGQHVGRRISRIGFFTFTGSMIAESRIISADIK